MQCVNVYRFLCVPTGMWMRIDLSEEARGPHTGVTSSIVFLCHQKLTNLDTVTGQPAPRVQLCPLSQLFGHRCMLPHTAVFAWALRM